MSIVDPPGAGEQPERGGPGLSLRPHCRRAAASACCSPARWLCSVTQHSLTQPPAPPPPPLPPAPRLATALPRAPVTPRATVRTPLAPRALTVPTAGPPAAPPGWDPPPGLSCGSEEWEWGASAACTQTSQPGPGVGDGHCAGSGPLGLPAQNPSSGFGELRHLLRRWEKTFGVFLPGGWD